VLNCGALILLVSYRSSSQKKNTAFFFQGETKEIDNFFRFFIFTIESSINLFDCGEKMGASVNQINPQGHVVRTFTVVALQSPWGRHLLLPLARCQIYPDKPKCVLARILFVVKLIPELPLTLSNVQRFGSLFSNYRNTSTFPSFGPNMPRYLFPCPECEQEFELETKQAGQDLTCQNCNATFVAPKLGEIRKLPIVGGAAASRKTFGTKSGSNFLSTAGLALALLGALAGGGLYYYASTLKQEYSVDEELASFGEWIDELQPEQVIEYYTRIEIEEGLGEWRELGINRYNRQSDILRNISYGIFGVGGIGVLMLLASMVTGKK
jgi:DNA-directed RNA polymerase subunit RPC12/RpoP